MTRTQAPRTDRSDAERFRDFDHVGPGTLAGRYLRLFWHPVYRAGGLPSGLRRPFG